MPPSSWTLRGKTIGPHEIVSISQIIQEHTQRGRTAISKKVCEVLGWHQPNGKPQDVAAREILRRLEQMGIIHLPPARCLAPNQRRLLAATPQSPGCQDWLFDPPVIEGSLHEFPQPKLLRVEGRSQARLWANLMERYHYLGYSWSVGRAIKYLFYLGGDLVGAIGWGSAAWKLSLRDRFVGWDETARIKNLQMLAGNHRFLILPSVRVKNLASSLLSLAIRHVRQDWMSLYSLPLYLLESYVDPELFKGTCYKAANWIYLGKSKGSSKSGNSYHFHGHPKDIYVYPLTADFREKLSSG